MNLSPSDSVRIPGGRPGPSASHRHKMGGVVLEARSHQALDVCFYNCKRLLWSCLDSSAARGRGVAIIADRSIRRVT